MMFLFHSFFRFTFGPAGGGTSGGRVAEFRHELEFEAMVDAARHVHKDFAEQLKFARLFRPAGEHDGLMVERQHVVQDEDILEFHI